jgi:gluconate 2-dehydrogenase gamma chain
MPGTTKIDRRAAIHSLLRGGLALSLVPGFAEQAWSVVAAGHRSAARALDANQAQMVARIADTILPRTDTPGAIDVGVPAWINLVLTDYFSDAHRVAFLTDLNAIDQSAVARSGAHLATLTGAGLLAVIAPLDAATGSTDLTGAQRGYVRLKELVIHGYFTSKPVQQDLLKVVIVPGRFDADVPVAPAGAA